MTRAAVAGTLWPDASETNAHGSLRSALSRLDAITREALEVDFLDLRLAEGVAVDIRDSRALAHRLVIVDTAPSAADMTAEAIAALSSELYRTGTTTGPSSRLRTGGSCGSMHSRRSPVGWLPLNATRTPQPPRAPRSARTRSGRAHTLR